MSENNLLYSIQSTYILTHVLTPEREIVTCDQRIDIPTIEPLTKVKALVYQSKTVTVVPCIELVGNFLSKFDLTFETNEGVTVLPVEIKPGSDNPPKNPYLYTRFALVLPRGATGVKSCKLIHKATGKEVQHNFTFGIMPPPYNYDNALFGYISSRVNDVSGAIYNLNEKFNALKLTAKTPIIKNIELSKGAGKQTINVENGVLFYDTDFYYISSSSAGHRPKITVSDGTSTLTYTLELDKSVSVTIDLLSGIITAYVTNTGEIVKQIKIFNTVAGYNSIAFADFDDIFDNSLTVLATGRSVE